MMEFIRTSSRPTWVVLLLGCYYFRFEFQEQQEYTTKSKPRTYRCGIAFVGFGTTFQFCFQMCKKLANAGTSLQRNRIPPPRTTRTQSMRRAEVRMWDAFVMCKFPRQWASQENQSDTEQTTNIYNFRNTYNEAKV
jgi:hypothetical protein